MSKIVYCNQCGQKISKYDTLQDRSMSGTFGYGSKYDGMRFEIDFCSNCFDKLIETFKILPFEED